jgi:hypothetical protein
MRPHLFERTYRYAAKVTEELTRQTQADEKIVTNSDLRMAMLHDALPLSGARGGKEGRLSVRAAVALISISRTWLLESGEETLEVRCLDGPQVKAARDLQHNC